MPGLDDARVHGSHRNFVDAVALDPHEVVFLLPGLPFGRRHEIAPQRKLVDGPARKPQPWTLVVGFGGHAEQVVGRALHPVGGREDGRQVRIAGVRVGQRVLENGETVAILERDANAEAAATIALVAGP